MPGSGGTLGLGYELGLGQSALARLHEPAATLAYFLAVWGAGAALLTAANLPPLPTQWSRKSLLTDVGHHAVYVVASMLTGRLLRRLA